MKSSFAVLILISILSCLSNTSNEKEMEKLSKKTFYEDIDFVNMKGIKVLGDDISKENIYFEINKKKDNIEIISFIKGQSLNKDSENTIHKDKEVFHKKNGGYYFSKEWIDEDNPVEKLRKEVFIIDKKIISILSVINIKTKKNISCKVEKVDLINKEIESLKFYKKSIVMSNDINIEKLIKSEKPFSFTKTLIKTDDFGLLLEHNFINFNDNTQEQYQEKYSGYPKKELNNYWNLYKQFYGDER